MSEEFQLFGTIALRSEIITKAQLSRALMAQEALKGPKRKKIGEILIEIGALDSRDVQHTLEVQFLMRQGNRNVRFGVATVMNGFATKEQVKKSLMVQKQNPGLKIGEIMVDLGILSEQQRDALLSGLRRLEGEGGKPRSRLVQAIRRIDEGGAMSVQRAAADGARMAEVKRLINEAVKSMTHLGVLSHIVHRQATDYSLRDFLKALGGDKGELQRALDDLTAASMLEIRKGVLGNRYVFSSDSKARQEVDLIQSFVDDPKTRAEVLSCMLHKA